MSTRRWSKRAAPLALAATIVACADAPAPELGEAVVLAAGGASNPTAAVDRSSGAAYVAWVDASGDAQNVMLSRREEGGEWSTPVRVNDLPGDVAAHLQAPPRVSVGPEGNVYVAWQNNTPLEGRMYPASDLRFARSTDGGRTFEPAFTVNEDAGGLPASHTFHDLIVAPSGEVVISWLDGRRTAAADAEAGAADAPGGDGAHAAHEAESAAYSGPDVRVAVSGDGGRSFRPSTVPDMDTCPCCRTDLAAGADGALYVGWREVFPGSVRDVVVARSPDGGATWETPVRVHEDGWVFDGCPHAGPALAVGDDGALHVAWYTGKEGASGLFYARSQDGGHTFSDAEPLVTDYAVAPSQVDLSVGPDGRLWAAWEVRSGGVQRTLLSAAGADPGAAVEIRGTHPSVAVGPGGAIAAWLVGDTVKVSRSGS